MWAPLRQFDVTGDRLRVRFGLARLYFAGVFSTFGMCDRDGLSSRTETSLDLRCIRRKNGSSVTSSNPVQGVTREGVGDGSKLNVLRYNYKGDKQGPFLKTLQPYSRFNS